MKKIISTLLVALTVVAANAQSTWTIDNAHSGVKFTVTHMVISEVEGSFKTFTGNVTSKSNDFTDANVEFTIDVASISTDNEMRDKHLKSDDFFNADKYPQIKFKSTSFKKVSGNKYVLEGDLTIRDVTKHVKWDVVYNGTAKDPYGNTKAGFKATLTIERFDYNLKWNTLAEAGPMVGKDVTIVVNVELKKQ
jgi:polyisoprenoid-binding protein YceI